MTNPLELLSVDFRRDSLAFLIKDQIAAKALIGGIPDDFYSFNNELHLIFTGFREFLNKYGCRPRKHELADYLQEEVKRAKLDQHQSQALFSTLDEIWKHNSYSAERVKQHLGEAIKGYKLLQFGSKIPDFIESSQYDEMLKEFRSVTAIGEEEAPFVEYWEDTTSRVLRRQNQQKRVVPTGFEPIDALMNGGITRGALAMVVAGSGFGKSAFMTQIAMQASLAGYRVAYLSLELDADSVMARMDSFNTRLPMEVLPLKGSKVKEELWKAYDSSATTPGPVIVKYYPTKSVSLTHIESFLERLRTEEGQTLDLLVVDYFDLLKMVGTYKNRWEALEENCEMLRGLAGMYDMAIWTAGQTRRDGIGKELVGMDDISAAFGKVFPLDVMVTMSHTREQQIKQVEQLHFAKNRLGPAGGLVFLESDFNKMRFTALTEDEAKKRGLYPKEKHKKNSPAALTGGFGNQGP